MDDDFEVEDEEEQNLEDAEEQELEDVDYADGNESPTDKVMNFIKENKKLAVILAMVIVFVLIMSLLSSGSKKEAGVEISAKTLTIAKDTSAQLKITKNGKDVTKVTWKSKDSTIASVDSKGTVKGLKVGKTTVTGTYNKYDYECEVTVKEPDVSIKIEKITIADEGIILMPIGSTYEVPIQVTPSEAAIKNKMFSSSEPTVAGVDASTGILTAYALGETTVRVSVNDGEAQANIKVRVVNGQIVPGIYVLPTRLSLTEKEITLTEGETKTLSYTQEPSNASTDYILWTSADEEIATVFNGELVARKAGNVEISISSLDLKDTMIVHVLEGEVPVTGINISSETSITMNVGDQSQIVATVEPSNATNQVITYLVDNPTILSVDSSGTISAFGSGSTMITVSPSSNLDIKRLIYVTVNEPYNPPDDPGDPGGGGDPTPKVGSVVITGTNNAVTTEVNGDEVDSTTITMTGSGNVDEIRFCFYNKASTSTCAYSIYTNEFELPPAKVTSKTTYVIKAVPYYQGKEGTEVVRYVTIKGSGSSSTPTIGYKIPSNNLYNNPGTASSYTKSGNQTITFDIVNGGVSYLKVCTGSNCTPSTTVRDNGTYSITSRGMITVRVSEYNSSNGLVRGPDTWYVYIQDESQINKCYCNSSGSCRWGLSGDGYTILTVHDYTVCKKYIDRGNVGCFVYNGKNTWGSYLHNPTQYAYISTIEKRDDCVTTTTPNRCYCNNSGKCIWGQKDSTHTNDVTSSVGETSCKEYINRGNLGCFRVGSTSQYEWGSLLGISGYVLLPTTTTAAGCPVNLVLKNSSGNVLPASYSLYTDMTSQIYLYVNGTKKTSGVSWISSKTSVATVSNGLVKTIKDGTVRITATYSGKSTYVDIIVTKRSEPSTLEFRNANNNVVGTGIGMLKGSEEQIYLYVNGTKTTSGVTWKSSNTSVATVTSGLIKAVGKGNTRITATYNSESTFIDLEVADPVINVGTLTITGNGLTTTKPTTSSSSVSATTIKVKKSGNVNKVKYCHTTNTTCTPTTEVSIGSSEITLLSNFSTEGIHTFIFQPFYNDTAGTKVTRYVYIKKPKTDPTCPTISSTTVDYDGKDHTITVSGGSGGTIEYRTSTTGSWTTTKPKRSAVGSTTVYVRVKGDSSHNDKECGSANITIKSIEPSFTCTVGSYYDSSSSKCLKCPTGYYYTLHGDVSESVITDSMLSGRTGTFKTKYSYLYSGNNYWGILQYEHAKYQSQCLIEVNKGYGLNFAGPSNSATSTPYPCTKGFYSDETRYVRFGSSSSCTPCPNGKTTTYQGSSSVNDCK